jgi:hypothetical protein
MSLDEVERSAKTANSPCCPTLSGLLGPIDKGAESYLLSSPSLGDIGRMLPAWCVDQEPARGHRKKIGAERPLAEFYALPVSWIIPRPRRDDELPLHELGKPPRAIDTTQEMPLKQKGAGDFLLSTPTITHFGLMLMKGDKITSFLSSAETSGRAQCNQSRKMGQDNRKRGKDAYRINRWDRSEFLGYWR